MRLADLVNGFYKGETLIVVKGVRDNATGLESMETVTLPAADLDALTYAEKYESRVLMFECTGRNALKVWTWREI